MFRRLREHGPAVLIPAAWTVVAAAHLEIVSRRPVVVMHAVMGALLVAFAAASWREMDSGVLRAWRAVILAGIPLALAGLTGFLVSTGSTALFAVAMGGWMLAPAAGFLYTARAVTEGEWAYVAGAAGCLLGVFLYAGGVVTGAESLRLAALGSAAAGQTLGILDAVVRY